MTSTCTCMCLSHSSCVGPGTPFNPPQCLEMLTRRTALQHSPAQITGQAILVSTNNAMVMALVNDQGACSWTSGHQGTALSVAYIPKGQTVAAVPLLRLECHERMVPRPRIAKSLFQSTTDYPVCLSHTCSSGVGSGTSFNPPQCLGMLTGRNALQHFWVQITG